MITNYQANRDLANAFGKANNTYPNTLYLGLSTSPTVTEAGFAEVSGNGYTRAALPNSTGSFTTAANKSISTATDISFSESTSSWGTIYALGIFDAATGGNMLYYQALTTSRSVPANTVVRFKSGSITVSLT